MKTTCSYCKKEIDKTPFAIREYDLHFCNKKHYLQYRRDEEYYIRKQNKSPLRKIKRLALLRKQRLMTE